MFYTMAQAKRYFDDGLLRGFEIVSSPLMGGWSLTVGRGGMAGLLVDARSKDVRVFRTLDAAVSAVRQVGFEVQALQAVQIVG